MAKVDTEGTVSAAITAAINALGISAYAKTADLGDLAAKDTVSESDLDTALAQKVNAASEGNHAHSNKTVLDGITAEKVAAWDAKADVSDIPTFTEATDAQIDAMFA